ncbi:MAG TPA: SMC family ATPase [Actinomycetota bacterium]|nr:SMC family ATPase [Actinomycetota bacterium]
MRFLELSLRNYRVFEEVDLELPSRVIGIFGPNGSGKTALVESLRWALYGRARTPKDQIRTEGVLTDCAVRLVFQHGGQQYEIRRTIKGRNHQVEAELFQGDLQAAAGVREVDEEIRRLLRMDDQVFRASVFAEQKQLDAFSDVTKGKRTEMVLRLLGIRPVDDARTVARREAREVTRSAERVAAGLPDVSGQEEALNEARAEAEAADREASATAEALAAAEARAAESSEAYEASDEVRQAVERIEVERRSLGQQIDGLQGRREDLHGRIEERRTALQELPVLETEAEALKEAPERLTAARGAAERIAEAQSLEALLVELPEIDPEAALAELQRAQETLRAAQDAATRAATEADRAARDRDTARATLATARDLDPSAPCPTCGQELGAGFESYVEHCIADVERLEEEARTAASAAEEAAAARTAAAEEMASVQAGAERARDEIRRRTSLQERLSELRERIEAQLEPLGGTLPDIEELERAAARAADVGRRLVELRLERDRLEEARSDLAAVERELASCSARLQELDRETAGLAFDAEDHQRLRKERDEARRLLEEARTVERRASDARRDARARVRELETALRQAREFAAQVSDLRDEARHLAKVSDLLDGFRDHLVARIGPELSREAEALFRDLTNREYDDLKIDEDTLAIHIADAGRWFSMERFSGSEADLANLALRVAISTHLSRMSGADIGMMVLDEVLASLDVERKDLFVQTMGRLADRFNQLFVITHAEQVKDQFPAQIEVRKIHRRRSVAEIR